MTSLTNEEIDSIWCKLPDCTYEVSYADQRRFAREVITADRAKQAEAHTELLARLDAALAAITPNHFADAGKPITKDES